MYQIHIEVTDRLYLRSGIPARSLKLPVSTSVGITRILRPSELKLPIDLTSHCFCIPRIAVGCDWGCGMCVRCSEKVSGMREPDFMRYQAVMILFSGAIGLCLSGCSSTSPVMRGQSPNAQFASWGASCGETGQGCDTRGNRRAVRRGDACSTGNCQSGNCQNGGSCQSGMCDSGMCQGVAGQGGAGCPDGRCGRAGYGADRCLNLPFHPVHRNFHTYDVPNGLTYPQQDTPPATYQYPYYTTRGPTDFFMK